MINIKGAKIYIFCPPNSISGGPEALHQLHYYMKSCNIDSYMVYYFSHKTKCVDRYELYAPDVIDYTQIEDSEKNIIIVPETATAYLKYYKRLKKCIWWLSVDNFFESQKGSSKFKDSLKFILNKFKKDNKYLYYCPVNLSSVKHHFCGSKYAYDFLLSLNKNIEPAMLVEPISKDFYMTNNYPCLEADKRENTILYNPSKPSAIMEKLLLRSDLKFKPLSGYTPTELINIYRQAKLYIDFGAFPGPERIPKESVYNGTCLLVGKRNASKNDFDIPIPEYYKIEDFNNEELVVERIKYILEHYNECITEFDSFRNKISMLETTFKQDINNIFEFDNK